MMSSERRPPKMLFLGTGVSQVMWHMVPLGGHKPYNLPNLYAIPNLHVDNEFHLKFDIIVISP